MKIYYINICFFCLSVGLTACPYKEVYKPVMKNEFIGNGLKVSPTVLFYDSKKNISICNIGFKIGNQTDSIQTMIFSKSYLINSGDSLTIEKIYALGSAFPLNHVFNLRPKSDTVLGLEFKGLEKNFGDTIKIALDISGVWSNIFVYKKMK